MKERGKPAVSSLLRRRVRLHEVYGTLLRTLIGGACIPRSPHRSILVAKKFSRINDPASSSCPTNKDILVLAARVVLNNEPNH